MERLGVEPECVDDMELAVTEACTNVLLHAGAQDEYQVSVEVNEKLCEIQVTDAGEGFDTSKLSSETDVTSETGRGIQLMKALVDRVQFLSKPQDGTIVRLIKEVQLKDNSALRSLGAGASS